MLVSLGVFQKGQWGCFERKLSVSRMAGEGSDIVSMTKMSIELGIT